MSEESEIKDPEEMSREEIDQELLVLAHKLMEALGEDTDEANDARIRLLERRANLLYVRKRLTS